MQKRLLTFVLFLLTTFGFSQESKVPLCGTPDSQIIDSKVLERMRNAGKNPNLRMADLPMLECIVSVAVEYEIYVDYNKNQDLIKEKVYQYFDKVSKVYEDEMNIKLTVNHIEIITTQRSDTLQKSKKQLGYHIAHLFRLEQAVPGFADGIAFIAKNSTGQYDLYCISGFFTIENLVLKIMAHEIGHCFDSPHTHNCNWPNGPLDACSYTEGGCLNKGIMSSIGSIMSYCIGSILSFHPYCREIIRNRADEILQPILLAPNKPIIESLIQNNVSTQPYLSWKSNAKTTKFQIQISDSQLFTKIIIDSVLNYNFFQGYKFENNKSYFYRLRAINNKGLSEWSDFAKITISNLSSIETPIVKALKLDKNDINNVRFEVYEVKDATGYEFRINDQYNFSQYEFAKTRLNNSVTFRVNTPFFTYKGLQNIDFYDVRFYWQARVIKNGTFGEWTPLQTFNRIKPIQHIYPKDSVNINTSFPLIWNFGSPTLNREYTLQVSEDDKFTKLLYDKNRIVNTLGKLDNSILGSGYEIIENLKPKTIYYYRYKEKEGVNSWQSSHFQTGSQNSKWKFFNPMNKSFWGGTQFFTQNDDSTKIIFVNSTGIYQTDGINWDIPINIFNTTGLIMPDTYTKIRTNAENDFIFNQSKMGLVKYDGKRLIQLTGLTTLAEKKINNFIIDKNNDLYVAIQNDSAYCNIYKVTEGKVQELPPVSKQQFLVPTFYLDSKNILWSTVGSEGVFKYNGKNWEHINTTSKYYHQTSFTIDAQNNAWWIEYNNGYYIRKRTPENIIKSYSISDNKDLPNGNYQNIISNKNGIIWVLGEINQKIVLFKLINEKWIRIDTENELPLPSTFISDYSGMAIDKQNRVWIFSNSFGIFVYDDSGQVKSQTITAEGINNKKNTTKPFKIIANASSGLPLNYKIISGPAKIQKDSIILTGQLGKVIVQISQSGNEIYEAAKNVELNFEVVTKEAQTISFSKIDQKTFGDKPFSLTATTTSGLPIIYQIVSGPAIINGNTLTLTGTGKVTIRVIQEGNNDFLAANSVTQEFCVIPAKPIITSDFSNAWQLKVNADKNIQWYFEGKKVTNGTQPSLLASENGKYQVEIANSDATCASNISEVFQLFVLATENEQNQTIKIFPNPADDWVTIDSEILTKISGIKLYDLKGSLLYSNDKVEFPHKIKVQHLWKGKALLEIKTVDKIYIKKLILL